MTQSVEHLGRGGAVVERLRPWRGQGYRAGALWRDRERLGRRFPEGARTALMAQSAAPRIAAGRGVGPAFRAAFVRGLPKPIAACVHGPNFVPFRRCRTGDLCGAVPTAAGGEPPIIRGGALARSVESRTQSSQQPQA